MNVLLTINGLLILLLISSQQWFAYDFQKQGTAPFSNLQATVFGIQSWLNPYLGSFAYALWFYFLLASLIVPLVVTFAAKKLKLSKRDLLGFWIFNPVLYVVIGFTYVPSLESPNSALLVPKTVSVDKKSVMTTRMSLFPSTMNFAIALGRDFQRLFHQ